MNNINKFLNVRSLEVNTTSKLFNYSAGWKNKNKKKNVDIRVLNKLQYEKIRCIMQNFLGSLLSAKRIGLNVKNDNEMRQCV